jgi:polyhydroxybutyrate depolymerase
MEAVPPAVLRWTAAAIIALEAGFVTGSLAGRPPAAPVARTAQAATRSSRLGRTAAPATPAPSPSPTAPSGTTTTMVTLQAGGLVRSFRLIRPTQPVAPRLPALVVLHGVNATIDFEERRDGLLPLADAGQAVLAYPVGYGESWNAGVCCAPAAADHVDDVGFLAAVIRQLAADPGIDPARVTLVGFSNGGRMAYAVDCALPGVVTAVVAVLAAPVSSCGSPTPVSLLAIATADDPEVPYAPDTGAEVGLTAVTDVAAAWRARDGCADSSTAQTAEGQLTNAVWSDCRWGSQVELATYASGGHEWQPGDGTTPSMGRLIWSFAVAGPGLEDPLPQ